MTPVRRRPTSQSRCNKLLCAIAIIAATMSLPLGAASAQSTSCATAQNPAVGRLRGLMEAVRTDRYPAILAAVESAWTADTTFSAGKGFALVRLGRLRLHGAGLQELGVCTEGSTIAVGEYRNTFTGMVDEVRVRVAEGPGSAVTRVQVYPAIRASDAIFVPRSYTARAEQMDAFMRRLVERDAFSGVVLVARGDSVLYSRAFGMSNRSLQKPNTLGTQFNLASMSKMMTAVVVLQLVDEGRLSLDAFVAPLLPERKGGPDWGKVQVKHLLSHTSGIVGSLERLDSPPGTRHEYSNFNFALLGEVIATVTRMRFEDALALRVLGPAEMANTRRYEIREDLSPDVTHGYTLEHLGDPREAPRDDLRLSANKYLHIYPGGSMGAYWSSATDVLRFARALTGGRLLKPATLALMRAPKPELGSPEYGFGTMLKPRTGAWGHEGDLPGADADLEFSGATVLLVLSNHDNVNEPVMTMLRALYASPIGSR